MRSAVWIALLKIIPPELQGKLLVVTSNGNEINVQGVYRVEDDFLVIRGRLAGTTDVAGVIFLPMEQIEYMGFREEVKEPELQAMFEGKFVAPPKMEAAPSLSPVPSAMPSVPSPTPVPMPAPSPLPPSAPPTGAVPALPTPPAGTPTLPGKAALLERLRRSRLGQQQPPASDAGASPGAASS